ncbi:MAG: hypothetical protein PHQ86_01910 [Dehalococcoidales bacterium]|nr:hypothetical protein [Dehalococcoidales bacterium]
MKNTNFANTYNPDTGMDDFGNDGGRKFHELSADYLDGFWGDPRETQSMNDDEIQAAAYEMAANWARVGDYTDETDPSISAIIVLTRKLYPKI